MFNYFRSRTWFRLQGEDSDTLEGQTIPGGIQLSIKSGWDTVNLKISPESAEKVGSWLIQIAARGRITRSSNVIQLERTLPISGTTREPVRGPDDAG